MYIHVVELTCLRAIQGALVWVPDREKVWIAGEMVTVGVGEGEGECVEVRCEGEKGTRVVECGSHDQLPLPRNPDILIGVNDLTTLSYLHEPAGEGSVFNVKFKYMYMYMYVLKILLYLGQTGTCIY